MKQFHIEELNREYNEKSPEEVIRFALGAVGRERIVLASSLSIEDQLLTDMLLKIEPKARIFFLDTGRHFQKTYDVLDTTASRYGFKYEIYAPAHEDLEAMVSEHGPNLFYESVENRKKCCGVRKVEPLKRVLSTVDAWICGLRKDQSTTRQEISLFEWDPTFNILKVNPIAYWSEEKVWEYIRRENVPYNSLYNKGFRSIGCEPCTRAVGPGEDVRSGRWWWENPDKKECGLHVSYLEGKK